MISRFPLNGTGHRIAAGGIIYMNHFAGKAGRGQA